ncbi:hypothetical protein [Chitinophaga solisilvae]|uniref:hypothetical protein n=1 Tax=Chitinophaga solisilvae TaxID=1233460 RepID=UPI00136E3A3C|nr:hypothetical protein [Chitinophaga solisilvae]
MKRLIPTLSLLLCSFHATAQLMHEVHSFPPQATVKRKSYNGSGGGHYWNLIKTDTSGKVIVDEGYRKNILMYRKEMQYDEKNNLKCIIETHDINRPGKIDTTIYSYAYEGNLITEELSTNGNYGFKYRLTGRKDAEFTYQRAICRTAELNNEPPPIKDTWTLTYRNGLLVKLFRLEADGRTEETVYEYDNKHRLQRSTVQRRPLNANGVYTGGPGGDDQSFEYVYNRKGYISQLYTTVGEKRYLLQTYKYK